MTPAIPENESYGAVASDYTSFPFPSLPTDIVRLVFESSVTPGLRAGDEQQRQRTAYAFCLVSKDVKTWVEPLLYEKVVLESHDQVTSFLGTLKIKATTFLARRAVKTVWILVKELPRNTADKLPILFSRCPRLERFTIIDSLPSKRILQNIPKPQSEPYLLQELTIIKANSASATTLDLSHLTLQRLHIINCSPGFLDSLFKRALMDKALLGKLQAIPQIYLDFTSPPNATLVTYLKFRAIPLWIHSLPESISILHIRASFITPDSSPADYIALNPQDGADCHDSTYSWTECFDSDVHRCGARLVLYTKQEAQAGDEVNPKDFYIDQCKTWLGLHWQVLLCTTQLRSTFRRARRFPCSITVVEGTKLVRARSMPLHLYCIHLDSKTHSITFIFRYS